MGLADRIRGRTLPTQTVSLPVDPEGHAQVARDLAAAVWVLEEARARGAVDTAAQRARVDQLQAGLDTAEVVEVHLTALAPAVWEELVDAHPPTDVDAARGHQWDVRTFRPALLAAAVVVPEGDEVPDWDLMAKDGALTAGELTGLFEAAVMLNVRGLAVAVGKGR